MGLFRWLFGDDADIIPPHQIHDEDAGTGMQMDTINPATGLPMLGGIGGVDAGGSPFGTDFHSSMDTSPIGTDLFNSDFGSD